MRKLHDIILGSKPMQFPTLVLGLFASLLTLANAYVHLDELRTTYDKLPSAAPGASVVKVGFPLLAISCVVVAAAFLAAKFVPKLAVPAIAANLGLQASALAGLILSRTGSVLGWTEPTWTDGATTTRLIEILAIIVLAVMLGIEVRSRAAEPAPS